MDPDANLKQQLELARLIVAVSDDPENHPQRESVCVDDTSLALAESVIALDGWVRGGGMFPSDWLYV